MLAALVAALALQDASPLERDIEEALRLLRRIPAADYFRGRQLLLEIGPEAIPALLERLNATGESAPGPQERYLICDVLGELRQNREEVAACLMAHLGDEEEFGMSIASAAARALGQIGARPAVPRLVAVLQDQDRRFDTALRWEAARALGRLRATEAASVLVPLLDDPAETPLGQKVKLAAIEALGLMRAREAIEQIAKTLDDATQDSWTGQPIQVHAVFALERITGMNKGDILGTDAVQRTNTINAWKQWLEGEFKAQLTRERMEELCAAIDRYRERHRQNPSSLADLAAGDDPLLSEIPRDAWGRDFVYRPEGTGGASFDLVCYAKDGQPGGGGDDRDLWNHDLWKPVYLERTRQVVQQVAEAVRRYIADNGAPPPNLEALQTRPPGEAAPNWNGPYFHGGMRDPWGRPLQYRRLPESPDPGFEVFCAGEDNAVENLPGADPIDNVITSLPATVEMPPETPDATPAPQERSAEPPETPAEGGDEP